MESISKRYIWIFFMILITVMIAAYVINAMQPPTRKPYRLQTNTSETTGGEFYTIRDEKGQTIFQTGLAIRLDDRYIDENNVEYIIIKVNGKNATANIVQKQALLETDDATVPAFSNPLLAQPVQAKSFHVVIYHSHSDESYGPTSGTTSKHGNGDIYQVGDALTETLRNAGVSVTHSRAAHDPHDVNAYTRSRRTLTQLLKEQPDAAYDVHSDSAPAAAYYTTINGVDSSRIMMVVGRSNPNMPTNLAYAKRIKTRADSLYPGLIRGIFIGHGDYNQDLYPTAMLFEIGSDTVSLDLAENAARCLGDVLIRELGAR